MKTLYGILTAVVMLALLTESGEAVLNRKFKVNPEAAFIDAFSEFSTAPFIELFYVLRNAHTSHARAIRTEISNQFLTRPGEPNVAVPVRVSGCDLLSAPRIGIAKQHRWKRTKSQSFD